MLHDSVRLNRGLMILPAGPFVLHIETRERRPGRLVTRRAGLQLLEDGCGVWPMIQCASRRRKVLGAIVTHRLFRPILLTLSTQDQCTVIYLTNINEIRPRKCT